MFCRNCGAQVSDDAKFCANCGANQGVEAETMPQQKQNLGEIFSDVQFSKVRTQPQEQPKQQTPKKKKKSTLKGIIIGILTFVLVFGIREAVKWGVENAVEGAAGAIGDAIQAAQEKTYEELDALAAELDVVVTGYEIGQWQQDGKIGPLLNVVIRNNSEKVITDVELAIATWDAQGNPLRLRYDNETTGLTNVTKFSLKSFGVKAGGTYGQNVGLSLSKTGDLPERIQAIPVKWTYSDGTKESNSHYEAWEYKYEDKANTRADLAQAQFSETFFMTADELEATIKQQPLFVTECAMKSWGDGDLMCATVQNNSGVTIQEIQVAYATWDAAGNPVYITWSDGEKATNNVAKLIMDELSFADGKTYGSRNGLPLHKDSAKVDKFIAIVASYVDADGNIWENPCYSAWLNMYRA